jgi:uncharacterized protein with von Willebrand factor type A (vWA) domain
MKSSTIVKTVAIITAMILIPGCSGNPGNTRSDTAEEKAQDSELLSGQRGNISLQRNFYFVFDGSGSMQRWPKGKREDGTRSGRKIEGAKWAVREFLKKVPKNVNLGLYVFDSNGQKEVIPLSPNNRSQFLQAIDAVDAGGGTPLGDAITKGSRALSEQYKKQLGYGEYRLIVITDGEATDNLVAGVRQAKRHKIPIYTIGFDMDQDHELRKHSVSYRSAESAKQVEQALEEAAAELDVFDPPTFQPKAGQTAKGN